MHKTRLLQEVNERLKKDEKLMATIADEMGAAFSTVKRWTRDEDPQLTQPIPMDLIRKHHAYPKNHVIYETYEVEAKISSDN